MGGGPDAVTLANELIFRLAVGKKLITESAIVHLRQSGGKDPDDDQSEAMVKIANEIVSMGIGPIFDAIAAEGESICDQSQLVASGFFNPYKASRG